MANFQKIHRSYLYCIFHSERANLIGEYQMRLCSVGGWAVDWEAGDPEVGPGASAGSAFLDIFCIYYRRDSYNCNVEDSADLHCTWVWKTDPETKYLPITSCWKIMTSNFKLREAFLLFWFLLHRQLWVSHCQPPLVSDGRSPLGKFQEVPRFTNAKPMLEEKVPKFGLLSNSYRGWMGGWKGGRGGGKDICLKRDIDY